MLSLAILIWLMGSTPVVIGKFALQIIWTVIIFYRIPYHYILPLLCGYGGANQLWLFVV
jgi:hypothetical protein